MKRGTSIRTTHTLVLEDETEYFTVKGTRDGKVFRVERVAYQQTDDRRDLSLAGTYLLKSGEIGKTRNPNYTTWEHSRAFTSAAEQSLLDALPSDIVKALREMGANV